ncbi:MAG: endonuclease/exonuclease/phosphatase family protein [Actinobacteria bacterium]|nr:endonuclease/exonuclease/phosphatase family protein [Actinomycetota bacterium]
MRTLLAGTLVAGALLAACAPASGAPSSVVTRGGEPGLTRLAGPKQAADLDVMTFNVQDSQILGTDRYTESGRRTAVAQVVVDERPDVIGTQEMTTGQAEDLRADLARAGVRYSRYGRPRVSDVDEPGVDFNETVAVFWNPAVLTDVGHGEVWFCPPDVVPRQGCVDSGPGWVAGDPRMATWVRLRHNGSGTDVVVVNTHLDAASAPARERGAEVVRDAVDRLFPDVPVLLTGDFNSGPDAAPHRVLTAAGWVDTWTTAARTGPAWSTFNRFDRRAPLPGPRIDRIYARPGLPVVAAAVNTYRSPAGQLPSDHYPVLIRVRLP